MLRQGAQRRLHAAVEAEVADYVERRAAPAHAPTGRMLSRRRPAVTPGQVLLQIPHQVAQPLRLWPWLRLCFPSNQACSTARGLSGTAGSARKQLPYRSTSRRSFSAPGLAGMSGG
jgi:hypothetical protein